MASAGFAEPWLEFEKELGGRPLIHGPTVEDCFAEWALVGTSLASKYQFPGPDTSVKTEDRTIEGGIKVRIYTPPGYQGGKPICAFFHGGGWAMGDLDMDDPWCRHAAKSSGSVVVSIDYRLTPQFKHPTQLHDCYGGYLWALKNAREFGAKEGKAWVCGLSAGGHLALAVALKLIDEGRGDTLQGVVAQVPVTIHPNAVPSDGKARYTSYDEHAEHTVNSKSAMTAFLDALGASPTDKYLSVLLHDQIDKLPKVYVTCATHDTLRDDARLLKELLDKKCVENTYDEFQGYPHYFWTFPSKHLDGPRADYLEKVAKGINFVLS